MKIVSRAVMLAAMQVAWIVATPATASAGALNDPGCRPSARHPYPVVVVHGQGGNFEGMRGVTDALVKADRCVYANNYGFVPGGANGQDHLATSATQIGQLVDQVLASTKAPKVDVVGHSAGVGVLDNLILKRGGGSKIHNFIGFGGLHHPYAHGGIAKFADASVYLPALTETARRLLPNITVTELAKTALSVYAGAGAPFGPIDPALVATATSNFTADLFDPAYWLDLQGAHSEAPGNFVVVGQSERSRATKDSDPTVCYTNIVGVADLVTGGAAGFQDEATNVENFVLTSSITQNAHSDMLGDPIALAKMLSGLERTCPVAPPKQLTGATLLAPSDTNASSSGEDAFLDAVSRLGPTGERRDASATFDGGCAAGGRRSGEKPTGLAALALAGVAAGWRRARRRGHASGRSTERLAPGASRSVERPDA